MILTKKTLITWVTLDQSVPEYLDGDTARDTKLAEMVAAGKTDGQGGSPAALVFERQWIDQAAAEEYIAFVKALSTSGKLPVITATEILDYTAPLEAPPVTVV
jgi:hypothetical protein